jgi:membrane protease YdiL (CAAX protease family)
MNVNIKHFFRVLLACGVCFSLFVFCTYVGFFTLQAHPRLLGPLKPVEAFAANLFGVLMSALAAGVLARAMKMDVRGCFKLPSWKQILFSVLAMAAYFGYLHGFAAVMGVDPNQGAKAMSSMFVPIVAAPGLFFFVLLVVVFITPVYEEFVFRGLAFPGIKHDDTLLSMALPVLITSLLWAGMHSGYTLWGTLNFFILGLLIGIFRVTSRGLLVPVLMHVIFNAVGLIKIYIQL